MSVLARLELRGVAGEPVDLWRTLVSHGLAFLPPARIDGSARTADITLPGPSTPRIVRLQCDRGSGDGVNLAIARLVDGGPDCTAREAAALTATLRRMLCLDDDLSGFYALAATDPALSWACSGAGRLLRSPTVFEDLVKIICTTNCA
jgi:N-glycosylase/DNA lyase